MMAIINSILLIIRESLPPLWIAITIAYAFAFYRFNRGRGSIIFITAIMVIEVVTSILVLGLIGIVFDILLIIPPYVHLLYRMRRKRVNLGS